MSGEKTWSTNVAAMSEDTRRYYLNREYRDRMQARIEANYHQDGGPPKIGWPDGSKTEGPAAELIFDLRECLLMVLAAMREQDQLLEEEGERVWAAAIVAVKNATLPTNTEGIPPSVQALLDTQTPAQAAITGGTVQRQFDVKALMDAAAKDIGAA